VRARTQSGRYGGEAEVDAASFADVATCAYKVRERVDLLTAHAAIALVLAVMGIGALCRMADRPVVWAALARLVIGCVTGESGVELHTLRQIQYSILRCEPDHVDILCLPDDETPDQEPPPTVLGSPEAVVM